MALEDLEQYFMKEQLLSMLDIDLKINYLQFQINQALDTGDEATSLLRQNKQLFSCLFLFTLHVLLK